MITQAEAFALASSWPVTVDDWATSSDTVDIDTIILTCRECGRSMGQLRREGIVYNGSLDEMLSMVLRHMVMAHDVPLAGLRKEATGGT